MLLSRLSKRHLKWPFVVGSLLEAFLKQKVLHNISVEKKKKQS